VLLLPEAVASGWRGGGQPVAGAGERDRWCGPGVSSSSVEMVELHSDPTVRLDSGRSATGRRVIDRDFVVALQQKDEKLTGTWVALQQKDKN